MNRDSVTDWRELSALYERADELDEAGLAALLDGLRAEGHRLLPALQRMLDARSRVVTRGFLEQAPRLVPAPEAASTGVAGARIGAYRLLRPIGSGGMAEVWLAERADGSFERQVAIKLLFTPPGRAAHRSFVERFKRERDILASLHDPHIASLHDAGVTVDGQPWLALELVHGRPITAWCDASELSRSRRVAVFLQVMLAVEHAHANLVIHRDLKPSNILVSDDGEAKLLDFGIAKLFQLQSEPEDTELTREGGRPLTPQYASPEQLAGRPLTIASDLYSLGVVLHHVLLGTRPGLPVPEGRAPLDRDLKAILAKMLEPAPEDRYSTVEAARHDLERWQEARPVVARRLTPFYVASRFVRRHRFGSAMTAVGVASLVVFAAVALVFGIQAHQESERAVAARDFVLDLFRIVDPDQAHNGDVSARRMLEVGRRKAVDTLAAQPRLLADVLARIGQMQSYIGDYAEATATLTDAAGGYHRAGLPREETHAQVSLAEVAYQMGQTERAARLATAASSAAAAWRQDHALFARLRLLQGWVAITANDIGMARASMREALDHATQAFGETGPPTIEVLEGLAAAERSGGDLLAARAVIQDAMARAQLSASLGPRDRLSVDTSWLRLELATGAYQTALGSAAAMLERCDRQLGERSEDCRVLRGLYAAAFLTAGERAQAARLLPKLDEAARDSSSPRRRGESLFLALRVAAASDELDRHVDVRQAALAAALDPALDVRTRSNLCLALAEMLLLKREASGSETWARTALALASEEPMPSAFLVGRAHLLLGLGQQLMARDADALASFAAALDANRRAFGASHPLVALLRLNEVHSLVRLGRTSEAGQLVEAATPALERGFGASAAVTVRAKELRAGLMKGTRIVAESRGDPAYFSY